MTNLESALNGAADDGIITKHQAETLFPYLDQRLGLSNRAAADVAPAATRPVNIANPLEDSEAPRFIRGFHDVLITIGIIVLLAGLRGLASVYLQLPVIILLAEILVRRQRLALPAVVLTLALVQWIWAVMMVRYGMATFAGFRPMAAAFLVVLPFPPLLALFYWRYRVPLSLAMLLLSLVVLAVIGVFYVIGIPFLTGGMQNPANAVGGSPLLTLCILFGAAVVMFIIAMVFDLRDPGRVRRWSDVAFWMHLATAPALLYTTLMLVLWLQIGQMGTDPAALLPGLNSYSRAPIILAIVLVLMLIGVIIDRRAFVTSGLVSLGVAVVSILRQGNAQFDTAGFAALLIVGLFVLTIGVGWPYLRRAIVRALPLAMQARLPVLR